MGSDRQVSMRAVSHGISARTTWRRSSWAMVLAAAALLAPVASSGRQAAADEEVAAYLLDLAKKDISARRYGEAIERLTRAHEEDPALLEALYLLGQAHEKAKEPTKALGAYRAYRDACEATSELESREERWLKTAQRRIEVLGKNEKELDQIDDAFSKAITGFALKHTDEDPDIAAEALRRLLRVQPRNESAAAMLQEITGEGAPGAASAGKSPVPGIEHWTDLLKIRAVDPGPKAQYKRGVLTLDHEGGSIFWTKSTRGPDMFVLEMEFRVTREYAPSWLVGFAFAQDEVANARGEQKFLTAFAQKSQVVMTEADNGKNVDLADAATETNDVDAWHHLTVAVQDRKVRIFLDGERYANTTVPGRRELAGPIGVFHQRCIAEIRMMRMGVR